MKRLTSLILFFILLMTSGALYANSGPIYWNGYPSFEILAIEKNSPIIVDEEDLIFDFTREEYISQNNYSISGLTTVKYTMSNPTDDILITQMAFPFVSMVKDFNSEGISIEVDGEKIPFEVFLGDTLLDSRRNQEVDGNEHLDPNSIVSNIYSLEYTPKNYDLDETGKLYTYDIAPTGKDELMIVIGDYTYNREKTRIMTKGFNGYNNVEGEESINTCIKGSEELEILVFGEDVDFSFSAYLDKEQTKETDEYSLNICTQEISLRDYLSKEVEVYEKEIGYLDKIADNQIFNIVLEKLDEFIEQNIINLDINQLFSLDYSERFFILIYDVEFQSNSTNDVSVSYYSQGSMNMWDTIDPIYTFDYILNPAKNWVSFNDLNIEIRPPAKYPYIIDSSIELEREEDGSYSANFDSLPEENLNFSLYYQEEVTFMDKVKGLFSRNSYFGRNILLSILSVIIGFIINKKFRKSGRLE